VDAVQLPVVDDEHSAPHLCRRDHHGRQLPCSAATWAAQGRPSPAARLSGGGLRPHKDGEI